MREVWQIAVALAFPLVCLALMLWLDRLEETLDRDVRRSARTPDPAPIGRMPAAQASDVSRSAAVSLGGRTKR
jgi:hypothetical protein